MQPKRSIGDANLYQAPKIYPNYVASDVQRNTTCNKDSNNPSTLRHGCASQRDACRVDSRASNGEAQTPRSSPARSPRAKRAGATRCLDRLDTPPAPPRPSKIPEAERRGQTRVRRTTRTGESV